MRAINRVFPRFLVYFDRSTQNLLEAASQFTLCEELRRPPGIVMFAWEAELVKLGILTSASQIF